MVSNLTFGKKPTRSSRSACTGTISSQQLSKDLLAPHRRGRRGLRRRHACYKMPKETEDEQAARKAHPGTMKESTEVPLQNCRTAPRC